MSDLVVEPVTDLGQITLRGDLSDPAFADALGVVLPQPRRITQRPVRLAWMSPDELLALVPREDVAGHVERVGAALRGQHHLIADVSDARVIYRLYGEDAPIRDCLARLSPADLRARALPQGEVRRTRLAQVPAAFWLDEGAATVIAFRSVAAYVEGLLRNAARTAVRHF